MSFAYCCKNNRYPLEKMASVLWFNSMEQVNSELAFYGITKSLPSDEVQFEKKILPSDYVSQFSWLNLASSEMRAFQSEQSMDKEWKIINFSFNTQLGQQFFFFNHTSHAWAEYLFQTVFFLNFLLVHYVSFSQILLLIIVILHLF